MQINQYIAMKETTNDIAISGNINLKIGIRDVGSMKLEGLLVI